MLIILIRDLRLCGITGDETWMSTVLLYSTNVFLKLLIQERYRNDVHFVWCSEDFDSTKLAAYSFRALVAASSNPADIYRDLQRAVQSPDTHNAKIISQRASFISLATNWEKNGEISSTQKDDIIYMASTAPFELWRPLLYVIPRAPVERRLQLVPVKNRAGFGNEYIISDLHRSEFDIIEF
jgi:hypothetical protein